jgi:hypothetical protein
MNWQEAASVSMCAGVCVSAGGYDYYVEDGDASVHIQDH